MNIIGQYMAITTGAAAMAIPFGFAKKGKKKENIVHFVLALKFVDSHCILYMFHTLKL